MSVEAELTRVRSKNFHNPTLQDSLQVEAFQLMFKLKMKETRDPYQSFVHAIGTTSDDAFRNALSNRADDLAKWVDVQKAKGRKGL